VREYVVPAEVLNALPPGAVRLLTGPGGFRGR
jgi:hypothetical protein